MKIYNASIYFTYEGRVKNPNENQIEDLIATAVGSWLRISDIHVEHVDDTEVQATKGPGQE